MGPTAGSDTRIRRTRQQLARAIREFAAVPLLVIACFVVLAVVSIVVDQAHLPGLDTVRHGIANVVGKQAATSTLQAIATGLVTVTSITFSVLLLAVQQTASSLSPVVFDQFVRRRSNQVFLGFFVGLALYSYVVLVAVQDNTPPVLGATIATLLTVAALAGLLILVYTTIDQMRPTNVLRQIHDRTLRARDREVALILRRTHRQEQSRHPVSASYRCETTGYVTGIDLDRLARALDRIPDAEIRLRVALGEHLAYDDVIATVRDDDESDAKWLADEVRAAVLIGKEPDLDNDPTTGIDELGNIAWTSASSAKHNPEIARQALHAIRDLAARWVGDEPDGREPDEPRLAVVYPDDDVNHLLDVLYAVLVAAHESQQQQTAARVLATYRLLLPRARDDLRARLYRDLAIAQTLVREIPDSAVLEDARRRLEEQHDRATAGASTTDNGRRS